MISSKNVVPIYIFWSDGFFHFHFLLLQITQEILSLMIKLIFRDFGFDWSVHFLSLQQMPVKIIEEIHLLNFKKVMNCSSFWMFLEQPGYELLS